MKYQKFIIEQYKGIAEPIEINIEKSDEPPIIPIIGTNESGKSTVLYGCFAFDHRNDKYDNQIKHLTECDLNLYKPENTQIIAYNDHKENYKVKIKKYNGGSWVDTSLTSMPGKYIRIESSPNNTMYIHYWNTDNNQLTVQKYANGTWNTLGSTDFSGKDAYYASLVISKEGVPYISYKNSSTRLIDVQKYSNGSWSKVGQSVRNVGSGGYMGETAMLASDHGVFLAIQNRYWTKQLEVYWLNNNNQWELVVETSFPVIFIQPASMGTNMYLHFTRARAWSMTGRDKFKSYLYGINVEQK